MSRVNLISELYTICLLNGGTCTRGYKSNRVLHVRDAGIKPSHDKLIMEGSTRGAMTRRVGKVATLIVQMRLASGPKLPTLTIYGKRDRKEYQVLCVIRF